MRFLCLRRRRSGPCRWPRPARRPQGPMSAGTLLSSTASSCRPAPLRHVSLPLFERFAHAEDRREAGLARRREFSATPSVSPEQGVRLNA
jgi:hypothetical protein